MIGRALRVWIVVGVLTCGPVPSGAEDVVRPAAAPPSAEQVRRWIAELANDRFETREAATKQLEKSGMAAVAPLTEATDGASLEVIARVIRALQGIAACGQRQDFEAAEVGLERLAESKHRSVSRRASLALYELSAPRRKHALARIIELGGIVKPVKPVSRLPLPPETADNFSIVLNRRWKGGDEGLVHLRRLYEADDTLAPQHLYVTKGAAVSAEALGALQRELPALAIEPRGDAMLGITFMERFEGVCSVSSVGEGSAAEKAGLKMDDVILKYDGERLTNFRRLIEITSAHEAGDKVSMEVLRDGRLLTLEATLAEWE